MACAPRSSLHDPAPAAEPEAGVGLLFMSFQAQLRQFVIQQSGSDGDTFPYNLLHPARRFYWA